MPAGSGHCGLRSGRGELFRNEGTQKTCQPCDKQPQIMSGGNQNDVDVIAGGAGQLIAFEQAVGFGVTDDRFDGVSSAELALDRG